MELSREEFVEMMVQELRKQGLEEVKPRVSQAPSSASMSLLSSNAWTAEKTYNELLLSQPRAPQAGIDKLAQVIVDSIHDKTSAPSWLVVNEQFVTNLLGMVNTQQPGTANLARVVFVDLVGKSLDSTVRCLSMDGFALAAQVPPGLVLPCTAIPSLSELVRKLEPKPDIWATYLEILRECIQHSAERATAQEFTSWIDQHFMSCLPGDEAMQYTFVQCFAGLCKQCITKRYDDMHRAVEQLAPTLTKLVLSNQATANQISTCFSVFEMFDCDPPVEVVQFACESWRDFRFPAGSDLFLENFLLQTTWKSSNPTEMLDIVRERALLSTTYTRAMWPLVFALQDDKNNNVVEQRLLELEPTKSSHVFIAYLAKHSALVLKMKQSPHVVDLVLATLLRVAPTPADKETDKSTHLNFKRVVSSLRGKNID